MRALLPLLGKTINAALRHDARAQQKLATMNNKIISIRCVDWKINSTLSINHSKIFITKNMQEKYDAEIKGTASNFISLFLKGADSAALFQHPIEISGDMQLIEVWRDMMMQLDIDWEEPLSQVTGDVMAHHIGQSLRKIKKEMRNTSATLQWQTQEYLHYELKALPTKKQVEKLYAAIATLRNDVDRLVLKS